MVRSSYEQGAAPSALTKGHFDEVVAGLLTKDDLTSLATSLEVRAVAERIEAKLKSISEDLTATVT